MSGHARRFTGTSASTPSTSPSTPGAHTPAAPSHSPLRTMRSGAGLLLGVGLLVVSLLTSGGVQWGALGIVLLCAACIAVALSGIYPILGAATLAISYPLVWFTPDRTLQLGAISIFIVVVMLLWDRERIAAFIFSVWYLACTVVLMVPTTSTRELVTGAFVWAGMLAAFAVVGELLGRQSTDNEKLEERRRQELADQRQAIARELHDTVVYSTTMMVMRAEAAKLKVATNSCDGEPAPEPAPEPDASAETSAAEPDASTQLIADLDFIAKTGRQATADLRSMLAVLRVREPQSTSAAERFTILETPLTKILGEQADKVREAGLTVQMAVEGDPASLPEDVASALAKIVTEACSNMVKHASREAPATIMIEVEDDVVEAAFVNGLAARPPKDTQGYGLVGLQERVETLGGSVDCSATDSRWIIRVSIPTRR